MKLLPCISAALLLLSAASLAHSMADCGSQPYCCPPDQQFPCNHGAQKPQAPAPKGQSESRTP